MILDTRQDDGEKIIDIIERFATSDHIDPDTLERMFRSGRNFRKNMGIS